MQNEKLTDGRCISRAVDDSELIDLDARLAFDSMVVYDEEEACPYLPDQMARMPLRFPLARIHDSQTDDLLSEGFRRSGRFLYQTRCHECKACEAIRIDVPRFEPNRSQRRALKKGNSVFELVLGQPICTDDRVALFNKHRNERGLNRQNTNIDEEEYEMFLVESCLESLELAYYIDGRLGVVAICDLGKRSVSAVYTYFDPELEYFSPGTYSIMKQIEYCQKRSFDFLYLGYYVSGSNSMNYKKNFLPHQRCQGGQWKAYSKV